MRNLRADERVMSSTWCLLAWKRYRSSTKKHLNGVKGIGIKYRVQAETSENQNIHSNTHCGRFCYECHLQASPRSGFSSPSFWALSWLDAALRNEDNLTPENHLIIQICDRTWMCFWKLKPSETWRACGLARVSFTLRLFAHGSIHTAPTRQSGTVSAFLTVEQPLPPSAHSKAII